MIFIFIFWVTIILHRETRYELKKKLFKENKFQVECPPGAVSAAEQQDRIYKKSWLQGCIDRPPFHRAFPGGGASRPTKTGWLQGQDRHPTSCEIRESLEIEI